MEKRKNMIYFNEIEKIRNHKQITNRLHFKEIKSEVYNMQKQSGRLREIPAPLYGTPKLGSKFSKITTMFDERQRNTGNSLPKSSNAGSFNIVNYKSWTRSYSSTREKVMNKQQYFDEYKQGKFGTINMFKSPKHHKDKVKDLGFYAKYIQVCWKKHRKNKLHKQTDYISACSKLFNIITNIKQGYHLRLMKHTLYSLIKSNPKQFEVSEGDFHLIQDLKTYGINNVNDFLCVVERMSNKAERKDSTYKRDRGYLPQQY